MLYVTINCNLVLQLQQQGLRIKVSRKPIQCAFYSIRVIILSI